MTIETLECIHLLLKERERETRLKRDDADQRASKYETLGKPEAQIKAALETAETMDNKLEAIVSALREFEHANFIG